MIRVRPGLVVGGAAMGLLALAALQVALPVTASNQPVDPFTTASIGPAPEAEDPARGSPAFRHALGVLTEGDPAGAYDLARGLPDDAERRAIQWAAIYFGNGKVPYAFVQSFGEDAPGFVAAAVFKTRFEQSLMDGEPDAALVIELLGGEMPNTLDAQIALAQAYVADGQTTRAAGMARSIWTESFLDAAGEKKVLAALGDLLDQDAHWARAVHLMMHDRAAGVERLLDLLTPAQKSLAVARIAVSRRAKDAKTLLDKVDPAMAGHPVYIFSRAQRARQAGLYESAVDWLDKAAGALPDAAEWWYERQALVRELLLDGNAKLAYRAAAGYREGPEGRLVEANFHAGWIALTFLKDAELARQHFEAMQALSTLPDSVTQANYWLGRALMKLGEDAAAKVAFGIAAEHGTVYYGLLARQELGLTGAGLRAMPQWKESEPAFDQRDVVRAVRLLAANGEADMAEPLLKTFAGNLSDGAELLLSARLAQEIGAHHLAIVIADVAEKRGVPLDLFSFPKDGLPAIELADIDRAAIYAITRQESRFNAGAVSSSGALGLMQLMPATARETAGKLGLAYSRSRLTSDPGYNAMLGSAYLASQLARYDGSLLLAAAAYNAGAGNADKWIAAFGDPRETNVDPVIWVELIPFQETRKYVQRVLGNYLVYRARLGDARMDIGDALRRIPG